MMRSELQKLSHNAVANLPRPLAHEMCGALELVGRAEATGNDECIREATKLLDQVNDRVNKWKAAMAAAKPVRGDRNVMQALAKRAGVTA